MTTGTNKINESIRGKIEMAKLFSKLELQFNSKNTLTVSGFKPTILALRSKALITESQGLQKKYKKQNKQTKIQGNQIDYSFPGISVSPEHRTKVNVSVNTPTCKFSAHL